MFTAAATRSDAGAFSLAGAGSSPFADVDEVVELAGSASKEVALPIPAGSAPDATAYLAVVLEANPSSSLVTQAASVIRVEPPAALLQRTGPLVAAVVVLMVATSALARFGRRKVRPVG